MVSNAGGMVDSGCGCGSGAMMTTEPTPMVEGDVVTEGADPVMEAPADAPAVPEAPSSDDEG